MSTAGKKAGKSQSEVQVPSPEAQASVSSAGAADPVPNPGVGGDQSAGNAGGEIAAGAPAADDPAAGLPDADGTAGTSVPASDAGPVAAAADAGGTESLAPANAVAESGAEALSTAVGELSDSIVTGPPEPGRSNPLSVNPGEVEVFPLRTYQDAGELRRRGGQGYLVDKRHAAALVQRGLATVEDQEGVADGGYQPVNRSPSSS